MTAPSPKVEQRHREAAADLAKNHYGTGYGLELKCREGSADDNPFVQAFAVFEHDILTPSGDAEGRAPVGTVDGYGEDAAFRVRDLAENGTLDPQLRADLRAVLAALTPPPSPTEAAGLREAAQAVLDGMSSTYRARNGREVGIEGEDGEKCWIVHSDLIEDLRRAALAKSPPAALEPDLCPHCHGCGWQNPAQAIDKCETCDGQGIANAPTREDQHYTVAMRERPKEIGGVEVTTGLYRLHWKSGGSSLAAIGMCENGSWWVAPTNWVAPAVPLRVAEDPDGRFSWAGVDRIERLAETDTAPKPLGDVRDGAERNRTIALRGAEYLRRLGEGGWGDGDIADAQYCADTITALCLQPLASLAAPAVPDREGIIEECARVCDERSEGRRRLYDENGASINAHKAVEAEECASTIRALKPGSQS